MYKVFVEYKVNPEYQEAYIAFMSSVRTRYPHLELLEATDQDSLYVEIWLLEEDEDFNMFKQERKDVKHPQWSIILPWIVGGSEKTNIWRFHKIL
ncbi:MAG: hypothetical protein K0Q81_14 [Paenibacillus sp.]|jgi:hypothetical protein|nr:hypothetical protein [Paenibacillus sp.]